jgi:hypothetical protein
MKWFDRWFMLKCKWAWENQKDIEAQEKEAYLKDRAIQTMFIGKGQSVPTPRSSLIRNLEDPLQRFPSLVFKMRSAENGHIIEVTHYDQKINENYTRYYLVNDGEDLGDAISKIITLETLRL